MGRHLETFLRTREYGKCALAILRVTSMGNALVMHDLKIGGPDARFDHDVQIMDNGQLTSDPLLRRRKSTQLHYCQGVAPWQDD